MSDSEHSTSDNERVWYDEMVSAFGEETIERDGVVAEVEGVIANSDDPRDDDARYSLEVRARSLSPENEQ
jgi:hypothetical protein